MKVIKDFAATGVEGFLLIYPDLSTAIPTGKKNRHGKDILECQQDMIAIRIYEREKDGKVKKNKDGHAIFKDYKVRHHDLKVKLLDGHFYETDEGNFIDYGGLRQYEREASDSDS